MPKYFGTDGIRGKSPEWLDSKKAYRIGYAIAKGLEAKKAYIGRDTRKSGITLNQALNQGLIDGGIHPINLGIVSTPMVQYLSFKENCFGIMITASHNPYFDNGIKTIINGQKSTTHEETIIESFIDNNEINYQKLSVIQEDEKPLESYLSAIDSLKFNQSTREVFLDTANGSLYQWAGKILNQYTKVTGSIGNEPDGININRNVGSTALDCLIKEKPEGTIGLAFDGDGDRLIAIDEVGNVVSGDQILAIINHALHLDSSMVFTKMVNPGIKEVLEKNGIKVLETAIGDKYVIEKINSEKISIGGEDSGHMIFKSFWPIGDGIISALLLLKALDEKNTSLNDAAKPFRKYPETLMNIRNISKESFNTNHILQKELSNLTSNLNSNTKVVIRPSGTEPVIRLYISHKDEQALKELSQSFLTIFKKHGGVL